MYSPAMDTRLSARECLPGDAGALLVGRAPGRGRGGRGAAPPAAGVGRGRGTDPIPARDGGRARPGARGGAGVRGVLAARGLWPPYLGGGCGRAAGFFTKSPPMAPVG